MKKNIYLLVFAICSYNCSSTKDLNKSDSLLREFEVKNTKGESIIVKSDIKGQLDENSLKTLLTYLNNISNTKVDSSQNIVLNYIDNNPSIHNEDYQVPWDIFYGDLIKQLNNSKICTHYWIINKDVTDLYYYHGDKINWQKDNNSLIKKMFFDNVGLNGGFVIIKPNGEFYQKNGEYTRNELLKIYRNF